MDKKNGKKLKHVTSETTSNVASLRCAARAAALEAKVREQVRLALGCGKARLHVRKAKLLAAADGPQRADHEAAWMVKGGWNRRLRRRLARAFEVVAGRLGGSPLLMGASSRPKPPAAPWGRAIAELGPC